MLSLLLSLFLMPIDVISCGEQGITVRMETQKQISFFNLLFDENKYIKACELILNGKKIEIIEEAMVDEAFYIRVDGVLLQEEAIKQNWARINDRNPSFLYANQMKNSQEIKVMAKPVEVKVTIRPWLVLSCLFILIVFLSLILTKL